MPVVDGRRSDPQRLRLPYQSKATGESREFLVYLPGDYDIEQAYRWPVIFNMGGMMASRVAGSCARVI